MICTARSRERGTATLEVVGMIPLVILLVFVLVQTAIALYGITTAQTAARQGARAYSQGSDPTSVVRQSSRRGWAHAPRRSGPVTACVPSSTSPMSYPRTTCASPRRR